jgi:hypothetical protein
MKEVFDSLPEWPIVELKEPSEPLARYHKGETEVIVHLNSTHSLSFYLNDLGLSQLQTEISERQKIRAIQNAVTVPTEM